MKKPEYLEEVYTDIELSVRRVELDEGSDCFLYIIEQSDSTVSTDEGLLKVTHIIHQH